jgi:hypothetical protein
MISIKEKEDGRGVMTHSKSKINNEKAKQKLSLHFSSLLISQNFVKNYVILQKISQYVFMPHFEFCY